MHAQHLRGGTSGGLWRSLHKGRDQYWGPCGYLRHQRQVRTFTPPPPLSLPLPPGPSAFILLYCIFFCVFMFSLLSLFLCRPDITVPVDWAWNTSLLTYCSPVSLLLSLCLSQAVSSVCLSVSLSWSLSLTHFLCSWLCPSVCVSLSPDPCHSLTFSVPGCVLPCVCLSLLIPVTHSLSLSVTLHLSVSFCLSVFLSLSPPLSEALIMILSVATRCGIVFNMLLLHNSFLCVWSCWGQYKFTAANCVFFSWWWLLDHHHHHHRHQHHHHHQHLHQHHCCHIVGIIIIVICHCLLPPSALWDHYVHSHCDCWFVFDPDVALQMTSWLAVSNWVLVSSSVAVSVFIYSHMYFSSSLAGAPPTHVTTAASAPSRGTRLTATVRPLDTKGRCVTSVSSSGAVWESRWTSWAVCPNEPSGFRGRKDLLHRALALVTTCP